MSVFIWGPTKWYTARRSTPFIEQSTVSKQSSLTQARQSTTRTRTVQDQASVSPLQRLGCAIAHHCTPAAPSRPGIEGNEIVDEWAGSVCV